MLAAVVDSDGVTDEGGENGGGSGPGLQDLLLTGLIQLLDPLQQLGGNKRTFFDTSAHSFISSLLGVSALDDELIGGVLRLAGLVAHSRLAPGSHRAAVA